MAENPLIPDDEEQTQPVSPPVPQEAPQEAAEAPQEAPVPAPQEEPEPPVRAAVAQETPPEPQEVPEEAPEAPPEPELDANSWDLDDSDAASTYGLLADGTIRPREPDEDQNEYRVGLATLASRALTDNQTISTGYEIGRQALNAAAQPEYLKYDDPQFEVPEEDLRGLQYHQQEILWGAKNKEHYQVLKARVDRMVRVEKEWASSSWGEYLAAGSVSILAEGAMITAAGAPLGPLGVVKGVGTVVQRATGLAVGSRWLAVAKGAALGGTGAAAEAALAYQNNVVSLRDAALQPLMGVAFGGAVGGIADAVGRYRAKGQVEINADQRAVELGDEAVARIKRAEREAGGKPTGGMQDPDPKVHPDKNDPEVDADLHPDGIKMPPEPIVKAREIIFTEDANLKIREKGQSKAATKEWTNDTHVIDEDGFRSIGTLERVTEKAGERLGRAFKRQGYRNMEPKDVYMVVHKNAHDFAKKTGEKIHVAFRSLAEAKGSAPEGAKFVRVRVGEGAKVVDGGPSGIHETVGVDGQMLVGNGKMVPKKGPDGKPRARSEDGALVQEMEWRPDAEIRGKPSLLGGKLPDGRRIGDDTIRDHNELMDTIADDIELEDINAHGSSVGAARLVSAETNEITLSDMDMAMAKDPNLSPFRESIGKGVARVGRLVRSKNPLIRARAQRLLGGVLDPNRKNREKGVAQVQSVDEKMDAWTAAEHSDLNRGYTIGVRAWKQANRGAYSGERNARAQFNRAVHYYRAFLNEGKPIPDKYKQPGVKEWSDQLDKFYDTKLQQLKDPALATKETSGLYQSVAGSEDIIFKPGHMPHRLNMGVLGKLKQEGYHKVLRDLYSQLLFDSAQKRGYAGGPEPFLRLAEYIEEIKWQTHTKGIDVFGKGMMNAGNADQMMRILGELNHGLPQNKLDELRDTLENIFAGYKGSSTQLMGRMDVDATRTVKIPKRDMDGNIIPNQEKDLALIDLLSDDSFNHAKHYSRKHNGWLALATDVEVDPRTGSALMIKVPDPNDPTKMIDYPKTIRSKGDIQQDLGRVQNMDKQLGLQEEARGANVARGGEGVLDQSDMTTLKRTYEYIINESGENPWQALEFAKRITYAKTLGGGWLASLQEIGSLVGHNGIRGIMRLPAFRQMFTTLAEEMRLVRAGQKDPRFIHQATQDLYELGVGDAVGKMKGSANYEYGADSFRHGENPGDETSFLGKAMFQAERFQNMTIKWGGLLPFQDYLQMRSAEAFLDEGFVRFRKGGKMANRHKRKWNNAGLSDKDIADLQAMFKNKDVAFTREMGPYSQFLGVNRSSPNFNAAAYEKLLMGVRRMTQQKSIMEQKYGSQVSGTDSGWWGAVTALKTFTIGSYSQQLANWASNMSEDIAGAVKSGAKGNFSLKDGVGDHVLGAANNAKIAMSTIMGAVAIGYLKDMENNWEKSEEWWKARTRRYLEDPEFMLQVGIDRGGLFSAIPLAYDHTLSPMLGIPDWNGFDIDDPGSEIAFGNAPMGVLKHAREAGSDALDASVKGKMTTNQFKKITSLPTNMVWYKQAMKMAGEYLEQQGILEKGKEWDPVKSRGPISQIPQKVGEKRSADWRLKKDVKNINKVKKLFLGDD